MQLTQATINKGNILRSQSVRPAQRISASFKSPSAFLNFGKTASKKSAPSKRETIIPEPSYNIPAVLLGTAAISHFGLHSEAPAAITGILGAFLALQASRVRFIFDDEALEVVIGEKTENNDKRWRYDTFVNWEFWWPQFPVLVYFKETTTKPEGQIHFFPLIFNGKQVYDVMVERCGPSQNSGPKN